MASIMWFRRDLRICDHPALFAAASEGEVVPVFILDQKLIKTAGSKRLAYLGQSLRALDRSMNGALQVHLGDPVDVLPILLRRYDTNSVHISEEFEPYGATRDKKIKSAGIDLVSTGSPYAVSPGRVRKSDESPYRVYTPFYRAWLALGWRAPAQGGELHFVDPDPKARDFPEWPLPDGTNLTAAGEIAAHGRFTEFSSELLNHYDENRNFTAIDGTSKMSAHLKWGEIHPRTLLANLGDEKAHEVFRREIAWREFYADVLFHNPLTENQYYSTRFTQLRHEMPGEKFQAWCKGETGFPFVDAAMRQMLREGWMHNRTRMVVASFLVKDLHIEWQHGADFFRDHLIDYDVASNSHGWQWTAGCGTDASPYYRIFNPIEQGKKFDPNGDYIRRYVPELVHLTGVEVHEPWNLLDGYSSGYPKRIVDHATERLEALARLEEIKIPIAE